MPVPAISSAVVSHPGAEQPPSDALQFGENMSAHQPGGLTRVSKLPKERLFEVLKGWLRADATACAVWRQEAKEMYDFRAGDQWNAEDRQILNAQSRPQIVFNRVLTILKAVAGMEINGRHEVHYIPRHNEDTEVNELLTGAGKWLTDECDAEDEESSAFDDANTCGLGWTEHRLDYELDPQGMYIEERVDPLEMYKDRNAKRKNLVDARRVARIKQVPLSDAMSQFPGKTREQLDATWALGADYEVTTKTLEEKRKREENTTDTTYDDTFEVTLVNMQWWERERYWMVADPKTNKMLEMKPEEYQQFTQRMQMLNQTGQKLEFMAVEMTRRVYKEAFLGGELLSVGDAALGQFKWTPITGEYNRTKGHFFGIVKIMRDPQMWANKWLSQSLHILNSTAKGGIVAEQDAFEDVRDAEEKWARADAIVWTKRGALSGDKPKILPRPGQGLPDGHIKMMEFAISAIRDVTGINLELLGMKDANQPGILEAQRKQAGMTVLATVFDSLRRFRKQGGRIRLHVVQNYLSDGRLIRVVGQEGAKALPLMKDKTSGNYNTVIDDAPTSPNQKEANWAIISQILPAFKEQLVSNPDLLVLVMEYSPLPSRITQALKDMLQKQQPQMQQQQQVQQQLTQASLAAAAAKMNKDQAQAELYLAQSGKQQATAMYDIAIAMAEFMNAHNQADKHSAQAAHERVKAAVAALTPIPALPNSGADQAHDHLLQAADQEHERKAQVGKQRFDLISQALDQQHEQQMANLQQAHERTIAAMQPSTTGQGNTESS